MSGAIPTATSVRESTVIKASLADVWHLIKRKRRPSLTGLMTNAVMLILFDI